MATSPLLDDVLPTDDQSPEPITNSRRLATGVGQSLAGPLNIARGVFGIALSTVLSIARFKIAVARRIIARFRGPDGAPPAETGPAPSGRDWRTPAVIALVVALVLAAGGVAFKLLRTPPAPPVAPEPPRVRPASGATGDSAPVGADEIEELQPVDEPVADLTEEDPRKRGE